MQLFIISSLLGLTLALTGNSYNKADEYKVESYKAGGYNSGGYHSSKTDYKGTYGKHDDYTKHAYGEEKYGEEDYQKQIYRGKYPGKCGKDGLYYNDEYTFMICSNNNAYQQKCAPGSRNSGYEKYDHGDTYYFHDFCDVNLVNEGYNLNQAGYADSGSYNYGGSHNGYQDRNSYQAGDYARDSSYGNGYRSDYRGDNRGDYRGDYRSYRPYN